MTVPFTDEQIAILDAAAARDQHILVASVAGSGKSTIEREAIKRAVQAGERAVVLTQGKRVATYMAKALQKIGIGKQQVDVRTMHSFGFWMIREWWQTHRPVTAPRHTKVFNYKPFAIMEDALGYDRHQEMGRKKLIERLSTLGRFYGLEGHRNEDMALLDIAAMYEMTLWDDLLDDALKVIRYSHELFDTQGKLDFTDMLVQPIRHQMATPADLRGLDRLFVDEIQDWNPIQRQLALDFAMSEDTLLFGAGDEHQEMYGFVGAIHSFRSTEAALRKRGAMAVMDMSVTFRCPTTHVDWASRYVGHLQARPDAPAGTLRMIDSTEILPLLQDGAAFYCRRNVPLIQLTIDMVRRGVGAKLLGGNLPDDMLYIIKRVSQDMRAYSDLPHALEDYKNEQLARMQAAHKSKRKLAAFQDTISCIESCYTGFNVHNVHDLEVQIRAMFTDEEDAPDLDEQHFRNRAIIGGSIHKYKGREADQCFYLEFDRRPGEATLKTMPDWAVRELDNIAYVGSTRSRDELYLVRQTDGDYDEAYNDAELLSDSGLTGACTTNNLDLIEQDLAETALKHHADDIMWRVRLKNSNDAGEQAEYDRLPENVKRHPTVQHAARVQDLLDTLRSDSKDDIAALIKQLEALIDED